MHYFIIEKKIGETPLEALNRGKQLYNIPKEIPCAYAGRLDPMASGKLLILVGDACKKQDVYVKLDKQYTFDLLLGFKSDSGDVLGLAQPCSVPTISQQQITAITKTFQGKQSFPYPHFSSKAVQGKPLFLWTLEKKLSEITIPTSTTTIYSLKHTHTRSITAKTLKKYVHVKINSLTETMETSKQLGENFRKNEILAQWNALLNNKQEEHTILSFTCTCSSGTYMRTLASAIADKLHTCGLAFAIHRTHIGKYAKLPHIPLWYYTF